MRKIAPKSLVEFIRKTPKGRRNFVAKLRLPLPPKVDGEKGGDYWISCLSAICNSFTQADPGLMPQKIFDLQDKIRSSKHRITKDRHQKNIDVLNNFMGYNLDKLRPGKNVAFIQKSGIESVLKFGALEINTWSNQLYLVLNKDTNTIGAVWFIAKINGFKKKELGIFTEILFLFLEKNFEKKYDLDSKYCIAIDVVNVQQVSYAQIENLSVPPLLESTLEEIRTLLRGNVD